jgi:hypothetical protein
MDEVRRSMMGETEWEGWVLRNREVVLIFHVCFMKALCGFLFWL